MIPSSFEYFAPTTLAEAQTLLRRYGGDAKVVAGGHSLIPLMKMRLSEPGYLIDLGGVEELSYIREEDGGLAIGAMTTYYDIESSPLVKSRYPVLAEATALVADIQVRNKGTIGGSMAHADPSADLTAVVLALEAEMRSGSSRAQRTMPAHRFFCGHLHDYPSGKRDTDGDQAACRSGKDRRGLQEVREQGIPLCGRWE